MAKSEHAKFERFFYSSHCFVGSLKQGIFTFVAIILNIQNRNISEASGFFREKVNRNFNKDYDCA